MVVNIGAVKSGEYSVVEREIKEVKKAAGDSIVKVIIETCFLNDSEKIKVCRLAKECGADFVKTSTGFGTAGASVEDVRLMRETVGPGVGVKASGGIRDLDTLVRMVEAGANRIGSSSGMRIMEQLRNQKREEEL
jgi:deoxyribose-phosphate aldolase